MRDNSDVWLRIMCVWLSFLGVIGLIAERYWRQDESLFWISMAMIVVSLFVILSPKQDKGA